MPRPFKPSRPASVPPPPAAPAPDVIAALNGLADLTHRYHQAINGLANFLFSAAGDEAGPPTPEVIGCYAQLALILADEGERIDKAVDALETELRRASRPAGGAQ